MQVFGEISGYVVVCTYLRYGTRITGFKVIFFEIITAKWLYTNTYAVYSD